MLTYIVTHQSPNFNLIMTLFRQTVDVNFSHFILKSSKWKSIFIVFCIVTGLGNKWVFFVVFF